MNYENGERSVPPKQAILFASAYKVTVDYIYFGKTDFVIQQQGAHALSSSEMVRRIPLLALENMSELERIAAGQEPRSTDTVPFCSREPVPERCIFVEIASSRCPHPREHIPILFEPGDKAMIQLLTPRGAPRTLYWRLCRGGADRAVPALPRGWARGGWLILVDLVPLNPNFRTIRISNATPVQIIGVCRNIHRIFDLKAASPPRLKRKRIYSYSAAQNSCARPNLSRPPL